MGVLALQWEQLTRGLRRLRAALNDPVPIWRAEIKVCMVVGVSSLNIQID